MLAIQLDFTSIGRMSLDTKENKGGDVPLFDVLVHVTIEAESRGCPKSGVYPFGTSLGHATIHVDSNVLVSPLVIEPNVVINGNCLSIIHGKRRKLIKVDLDYQKLIFNSDVFWDQVVRLQKQDLVDKWFYL